MNVQATACDWYVERNLYVVLAVAELHPHPALHDGPVLLLSPLGRRDNPRGPSPCAPLRLGWGPSSFILLILFLLFESHVRY